MDEEYLFFIFEGLFAILIFLMGCLQRRNKPQMFVVVTVFAILTGFFVCIERHREAIGKPREERSLSDKTTWKVLSKTPQNDRFLVWIKNVNTGEIVGMISPKEPPSKFLVKSTGWWKFKKVQLIALEEPSGD